jgi:dipeptidyl aminopeptidase/acylaminoacyl peptidase
MTRPHRTPRFLLSLAAAPLVLVPPQAPAAAQSAAPSATLTVDDLRLDVGLSSPAIAPDGRAVALVTTRPDYEENRFVQTLVLVDVATGAVRELTPGRRAVGGPRWSPAGDRLAFLDVDNGKPQIFVLPLAGGEARRVTAAAQGVKTFRWAGAEALLYTSPDPAEMREGEERHNKSFVVGANSYLTQAAPTPVHLWHVSVDGGKAGGGDRGAAAGEARRLTSGEWSIGALEVSPDGAVAAVQATPRPHTGERIHAWLRSVDVATGRVTDLVMETPASLGAFSPDGRSVLMGLPRGPEPGFNPSGIHVQAIAGGARTDATPSIDRALNGMEWLPDGRSLLLNGSDLTAQAFWLQPLAGEPRRLDLGAVHASSRADVARDGTVAFIGREAQRPAELYVMKAGEWRPRRLTDLNAALAAKRTGRVETVTWDGPDGFRQNGVLIYPPDYQAGRRYPLVLNIHGGPMGASTEGFNLFDQLLAAQGWLVFAPNYRGSSTQGRAFQAAVVNDAGEGPGRDVMSGIAAVKGLGIVDEQRVAVSGWSYGGYMTAWLTAHYDGWAAAMAGAAVTDWFDWYSMADMNTWAGYGLDGSPWLNDNAMNYWRQSPMAYAHRIRTPTLILSNTGDERVTVSQSYKLFHALRDNGVEVEFVAYPIPGHFPGDPVHQRDLRRRWIGWIADHFGRVTAGR